VLTRKSIEAPVRFVRPDDVASTVLAIVRQPRSAWSFEVEARPFGEKW
jgi:hypothetical protein